MENFIYKIQPSKIEGEVRISGAKNSSLRLLAASLLTNAKVKLTNNPNKLLDVLLHIEMLESLGKTVTIENEILTISEGDEGLKSNLNWDKRSIRNTILIAGALLARTGSASVPLPGGCKLGDRKIDLHVMIFEKLGASVEVVDGHLHAQVDGRLTGAEIRLPIRSTGATENALMCGTLAKGKTTIYNPHVRPEVLDLIVFLRKIGARINVFGQDYIEVYGIDKDVASEIIHPVVPDNVEAITWLMLAIMHKSEMQIHNFPYDHLVVPLQFLLEGNSIIKFENKSLRVIGKGATSFEIATGPYPGINSDMQPIFGAYALLAKGKSIIHDLRFLDRFQYVDELRRFGAKIEQNQNTIEIHGGHPLKATTVKATDLRGGMATAMIASLLEDTTIINDAFQIERGYNDFASKFENCGGIIKKEFID